MNKLKRISGLALLSLCMGLCVQVARGQDVATILSSFTNFTNDTLYAEVAINPKYCRQYRLSFSIQNHTQGLSAVRGKIIGVQQPIGSTSAAPSTRTYEMMGDSVIYNMELRGYTLAFGLSNLGAAVNKGDSLILTVKPAMLPFVCENCGINKTVVVFTDTSDIEENCPFVNNANANENDPYSQLIACRERPAPASNWEAFIVDKRDCKPYRIVIMPDGRWWMAENLRYVGGLASETAANANAVPGYYYAYGSANIGELSRFGVAYRRPTFMRADGLAATADADVAANAPSTTQGICPQGWLMPSDKDWAVLLDSVEGKSVGGRLTNHASTSTGVDLGTVAGKQLRSVHTCRTNLAEGGAISCVPQDATVAPRWLYKSVAQGNIPTGGVDTWGFSVLPGSYRRTSADAIIIANPSFNQGVAGYTAFASATDGISRRFDHNKNTVARIALDTDEGVYVRCVRSGSTNFNWGE